MKRTLSQLAIILAIGALGYSSYLLHSTNQNELMVQHFDRSLEKKLQLENTLDQAQSIELQQDIQNINLLMEEQVERNETHSKLNLLIDIALFLCLVSLYLIANSKGIKSTPLTESQ